MPDNFTALFEAGFNQLAQPEILPGRYFGPFKIVNAIGQGGMSSVYLAERADNEYHQQVAIKVFPAFFSNQQNGESLNTEAQALASLSHPNIVPVLDAGRTEDNLMYIVMRLIQGKPLNEWLQQQALTINQKLKLLLPVLDALQHAHNHQILHADIKPQNILVDEEGVPYLVDFGICHLLGQDHGRVVGQYAAAFSTKFASPEQLAGERLTTATDIFSAGKLLKAVTAKATGSKVPLPLQRIIDTATHNEPAKRYLTIHALQTDIERFLTYQPVSVLPDLSYRSGLWLYRQRYKVASAAIVAILLGITAFSQYKEINTAKQSENALAVVQHLLGNVDKVNNSEVERQRDILSTSESIDIDALPPEQAAPIVLAQAEAYQILGDYPAAVKRAERLREITAGQTGLTAYYTVAMRFLAEEHIVYGDYNSAIATINLIIDALKAEKALTSPVYEKLLIWMRTTNFLTFSAAIYRVLQLLKEQGFDTDSNPHRAQLTRLIEIHYQLSTNIHIDIAALAEEIINTLSLEQPIQLQVASLKSIHALSDKYGEYRRIKKTIAPFEEQLERNLGKSHPAILNVKLSSVTYSAYHSNKLYLKYLTLIDNTNNATYQLLTRTLLTSELDYLLEGDLSLFVAAANKLEKRLILTLDLLDNYIAHFFIYLLTEFNKEDIAQRLMLAQSGLAKRLGSIDKEANFSRLYCSGYVNEYYPPANINDFKAFCHRAITLNARASKSGIFGYRTEMDFAVSLIHQRDAEAYTYFSQLTESMNQHNAEKKAKYYRAGAHLYLWKNELDKAEEFLNAIKETTLPHWSYADFVFLKAKLLFKQGNELQAVAMLDDANELLCRKFSHDDYRMKRIRELRAEMQLNPVDSCPDAVTWQDLDPTGAIEAGIIDYIERLENFQPLELQ
ncbi:MAG: serine/threonine-protein kinase [Pseudomonadota bacterium]|nr:serine/threonine-protein kinase [Pseudomonadota bacterium]